MLKHLIKFLVVAVVLVGACGKGQKDSISVVTFNMYVGFDAEEKFAEFEGGGDLVDIALGIFSDFQGTQPEDRIAQAGEELAMLSPDFICLQEVTTFGALPLFYVDYINLLVDAIKNAGGPAYEYITAENMALQYPVDTGSVPVVVAYSDSEAILYKKGFKIEGDTVDQKLETHRDSVEFDGEVITFYRSVLGARFKYGNERVISLFTTHLDQENLGSIQSDQMQEMLHIVEPYRDDENLVLVGDFNSGEGEITYELIVASDYVDSYRELNTDEGLTCCSVDDLSNETSTAVQKIDLIFYLSTDWYADQSSIILNTKNPLWPSDHFGVLTEFKRNIEQ